MATTKSASNYFVELKKINVNEHIERKGQFSYLSWPFAVEELRKFDPTATWVVQRFDGLPYLKTDMGVFVEVAVTVQGVMLSQIHPVLDGKNRPLLEPSAFDINTSIQRALVKAIALHGLGLYIYAGEDLPDSETLNDANTHTQSTQLTQPATVRQFPKRDNCFSDPELLTVNQLRFIKKLIAETGTNEEQLLGFFGFDSLENIPKAEVNRVIKMLENNRKAA
jgi:hypothetical protein